LWSFGTEVLFEEADGKEIMMPKHCRFLYHCARCVGRLPEFKGQWRIARALYPQGSKLRIRDAVKLPWTQKRIIADSDRHVGWHVLIFGGYEKREIKTMMRLLKGRKVSVAIDAGAHVGLYSLYLSELSDRAYAFEPVKVFRSELMKNLELNRIGNVEVVEKGLGEEEKSVEMACCCGNSEEPDTASVDRGIYEFNDSYKWKREKAELTYLDKFVSDKGIGRVDFIKIDADGSEYEILVGAKGVLAAYKPIIQIELDVMAGFWGGKGYIEKTAGLLKQRGYHFLDSKGRYQEVIKKQGNYFAVSGLKAIPL